MYLAEHLTSYILHFTYLETITHHYALDLAHFSWLFRRFHVAVEATVGVSRRWQGHGQGHGYGHGDERYAHLLRPPRFALYSMVLQYTGQQPDVKSSPPEYTLLFFFLSFPAIISSSK